MIKKIVLKLQNCFKKKRSTGIKKTAIRMDPDVPDELYEYKSEEKPYWTCDGKTTTKIHFAKVGIASKDETPPRTYMQIFRGAAERHGNKVALRVERPVPILGAGGKCPPALPLSKWMSWTWQNYYDESVVAACSLLHLGVSQHDSVCVFGFNSPEWLISQNAAIMAGAKIAGIYPSDTVEQLHFKIEHSAATVTVIENSQKLLKLRDAIRLGLPKLKAVVM